MRQKIKTAIIGMGKMGRIRYNALALHGGFDIVALCDVNECNLTGYTEDLFHDWQECIDKVDIEAVFICTFNNSISSIVCYALQKGIHVFSEKPPGRNLADTLRMQEAHKGSAAVLKFGFNHRFHNSVIEAKALVESGLLGDIVCIRGVYGKAGSASFGSEWRNNPEISGGGILLDQGIHMLDLTYYFLGEFSTVKSSVGNLVWKEIPTEDSAFIILETASGRTASLHSSAIQWKHKFDFDIICSQGYIALNGFLTASQSYGEECLTYYRKDLEKKSGNLGCPKEHTLCFTEDNSWDLEISEFFEAVSNGARLENGTIEQSVYLMSLIEKVYGENDIDLKIGEDT